MTRLLNLMYRSIAPKFRIDQAVDAYGQAELRKLMTQFGWMSASSRELDNIGVDGRWFKEEAVIDIQQKARNIDSRDKSYSWKLCEQGQSLNPNFYNRPQNYLFVIGFNEINSLGREFIPATVIRMGLIPAKVVYENLHTNRLTVSDKKLETNRSFWSPYFGIDAIRKTLSDEIEQQRNNEQE